MVPYGHEAQERSSYLVPVQDVGRLPEPDRGPHGAVRSRQAGGLSAFHPVGQGPGEWAVCRTGPTAPVGRAVPRPKAANH
eukprot:5028647-Prymnesium_polylepis.1